MSDWHNTNKTKHAESLRESLEHLLTYFATEDDSHRKKALEAAKDAQAFAYTRRESVAARKLALLAAGIDSTIYAGLA